MSIPSWYLDERGHAGPEYLDADYVATYDDKAQLVPQEDLDLLSIPPNAPLIDIGAGTGTFGLAAAPHCDKVIAVDVSPRMLDVLRRTATEQGVDNIEIVEAGFLS